jgi:ParB family transcriptional regulator, chromosome partitioning protein
VLDADSQETGMFEILAGGRRYRALELLVKQKRMNKTQPVHCVVRTEGLAEEDSLAENVERAALHPLDRFRAFQTLREKGLSQEDIAALFFVSPTVVTQRLKLAAISQKLLDVYAERRHDAGAANGVHSHQRPRAPGAGLGRARPQLQQGPYHIRRQVTGGAVRAADKRAQFVGIDVYEVAGDIVTRDL